VKTALYLLGVLRQLRRIAVAIEDANEIARERLKMDYPPTGEAPRPRPAVFATPSIEELNDRAAKRQRDRLARGVL